MITPIFAQLWSFFSTSDFQLKNVCLLIPAAPPKTKRCPGASLKIRIYPGDPTPLKLRCRPGQNLWRHSAKPMMPDPVPHHQKYRAVMGRSTLPSSMMMQAAGFVLLPAARQTNPLSKPIWIPWAPLPGVERGFCVLFPCSWGPFVCFVPFV